MKKTLLLLVGCLLIGCSAGAVNISASDTNDSYEARFARLSRTYARTPNDVENLYEMARFYADAANPMYNIPLAMQYIRKTEENHISLLERDKLGELGRLARKDITLTTIRQTKQAITDAAYTIIETRTDMSGTELDTYMEAFDIDITLVRKLRQRRIAQVFDDDLRKGTVDAYYHFITIYPGTSEAEQMENRIALQAATLFDDCKSEDAIKAIAEKYPNSPSVQREAKKHLSGYAYAEACRENTIQSYKRFLRHYPSSNEDAQARERLETLIGVQYSTLRTPQEIADFVDSNIDNNLSEKALAQLRRMITDNHDVTAARIYLDRFKMDAHYNDIFSKFYSWHSAEGNGAPIKDFTNRYPDFPFQRIVDDDLDFASRADRINFLEEFLEMEYPSYASHVRQLYGKKISFVPLQRMIQGMLKVHDYKGALDRIRQFDLCFDNVAHREYNELVQMLQSSAKDRKAVSELEANYDILNPSVNEADGRLYFTRTNGANRRICYATKQGKKWVPTSEVAFDNVGNDGLTLFSFFDRGNHMLLGKDGDIWIAERDGEKWHVTEIPEYPVNTDHIEVDAFMLPDGSGMLLASDRPGGHNLQASGDNFHGDTALATDIYFIPLTQRGWGEPVNLGLSINSEYCERSPILSRNQKTLYFVTDGRGGLGFTDIMMATRNNIHDWQHWNRPQNLGKEINTGFTEGGLSFAAGEHTVYFSSNVNRSRFGCYSFHTTHDMSQTSMRYSVDILGMEGFLYKITLADLADQQVTEVIHCNGTCHNADLNIQKNRKYALLGDAGFYFVPAVVIDPSSADKPKLRGYTFPVLVASEKPIPLDIVDFEQGTAQLKPLASLQLEQLATFLERTDNSVAEFSVDVAGRNDKECYDLSLQRGATLRSFMTARGISPERIIISAYGNVHAKNKKASSVSVKFREQ